MKKHQEMKDTTKIELNKWPEIPVKIVFSSYLFIFKLQIESVRVQSLQIESRRTGVYRYKVEELVFTDRYSGRTGVYR